MGRGQFGYGNFNNVEFLGKRAINKSIDVFSRKQVVVGDGSDTKRTQTNIFREALEKLNAPLMSDMERARLNVLLPRVFETLLNTNGSSYIAGIGGEETAKLAGISMHLVSSDENQSVAFRVVFGATEQMPLRALSYVLPALTMMERLKKETGKAPQLQVVFANQISSRLNKLDDQKTNKQSLRLSKIAKEYIGEFFPELADSAIFLRDTSLNKGTVLRSELINVVQILAQHLSSESKGVLSEKGNNSGRLNSYYAAAHLLMHDRDGSEYLMPLLEDQQDFITPDAIVSFGGKQERLFYKIRHELKPHLGDEYNSVQTFQYFTRHHVPPYYMAKGGDVALEDALAGRIGGLSIAPAAMHDLNYLRNISISRGDLYDFLKRQGGFSNGE